MTIFSVNSLNIPNRKKRETDSKIIGNGTVILINIYRWISMENLIELSRHKPETENKQTISCWYNFCLHWRGKAEIFQFYYRICSSGYFIWINFNNDKIRFWVTKLLSVSSTVCAPSIFINCAMKYWNYEYGLK